MAEQPITSTKEEANNHNNSNNEAEERERLNSGESFDSDDSSELLPPPPPPEATSNDPIVSQETEKNSTMIVDLDAEIDDDDDEEEEEAEYTRKSSSNTPNDIPAISIEHATNPDDEVEVEPELVLSPSLDTDFSDNPPVDPLTPSPTSKQEQAPPSTEKYSPIEQRLAQALLENEGSSNNRRSPDLVPLTQRYQAFRKELRTLIASIKAYQQATQKMQKSRSKLFQELSALSENSPLYDYVGEPLEEEKLDSLKQQGNTAFAASAMNQDMTNEGQAWQPALLHQFVHEGNVSSLASKLKVQEMHQDINETEYEKFVLAYAIEWEAVVTKKLDKEIKNVQQLQNRRRHYDAKVDKLRRRVNTMESRGKETPAPLTEKLVRNEQKLTNAWETHEKQSSDLCVLLEQVTQYGWIDLMPLVMNVMRYEVHRTGRENLALGSLSTTLDAMKNDPHLHMSPV